MSYSLNSLYQAAGTSKQAFHQRLDRQLRRQAYVHQLVPLITQIRADHPTMGCRDMYYLLQPEFIGRDNFERFCKEHGFSSLRLRNYRKTTDSTGVIRFIDLTQNLEITHLNQVWVSDITYYSHKDRFYYITFIIDAFSRRIIGYHVSKRLFTMQTTLPALKMAVRTRQGAVLTGTIFHSDGGGQYYDSDFLDHTQELKLYNSMCEYAWENGKAERINGVIKNNYLIHRDISTFKDLQREVDRAVYLYNHEKPHIALNRLSPINYEKMYISRGKISDGEKSTTEWKSCSRRTINSPTDCREISSGLNITQE